MKKIFLLSFYVMLCIWAWGQQVTNVDFTTEGKYRQYITLR